MKNCICCGKVWHKNGGIMEKVYIGIDLGGTTIKSGMMTKDGKVLVKWQTPTQKEKGVDGVLLNVKKTIDYLLKKTGKTYSDVQKIGFGIPGIAMVLPAYLREHLREHLVSVHQPGYQLSSLWVLAGLG